MPINLNNLDISLDQFNAVSNGKYNIGQLKLSDDGMSVYRTNNHKTLTFLNTTKISPDEALAVKLAFCKALANAGHLEKPEIASIKEKLCIPEAGVATFKALKEGTIKPLTAAEVRSFIDEYLSPAGNATGKGSNGGVSGETMDPRAATREKINNRTFANNRTSMANNSINSLLNIMECSKKEGGPSLFDNALAKELGSAIEVLGLAIRKHGNCENGIRLTVAPLKINQVMQDEKATIVATITLDDGKEMTFDTGLTKEELQAKVNDFVSGKSSNAEGQVEEKKDVAADGAGGKAEGQVDEQKDVVVGDTGSSAETQVKEKKDVVVGDTSSDAETHVEEKKAEASKGGPDSNFGLNEWQFQELMDLKDKLTYSGNKADLAFYNALKSSLPKLENVNDRVRLIDFMATEYADLRGAVDVKGAADAKEERMEILETVVKSLPEIKNDNDRLNLVKIVKSYANIKRLPVVDKSQVDRKTAIEAEKEREKKLKSVSDFVLKSLKGARGFDSRNTDLTRKVMDAFESNGTSPKFSEVIKDLADVFSEAQIGRKEVDKYFSDLKDQSAPDEDDIKPLNINEWLGGKLDS